MAFAECCSHPNIPRPCVNIPLDRSRSDPCQSAYHCTHPTQFRHVGAMNLQELDSKLWGPLVMSQLSFSISQVTRRTSRKKQLLSIEFGCIEFGSCSSDTRPRKQPVQIKVTISVPLPVPKALRILFKANPNQNLPVSIYLNN